MSLPANGSRHPRASIASSRLSSLLTRKALTSDTALLLYLAALDFLIHLAVAGNYGYFRDELYYIIGGRRLAFGYVDYPPLISWLAALLNLIAGDALVVIHLVSALAIACVVFVTGLIARELGGGRRAQLFAAVSSMVMLVFLATGSIFSMDVLDELWWTLGAYVVVRLIRRHEPRLWLVFGLIAGVGLLTKLTMLFFGFGLVVGLALTPNGRAFFRSRWLWLGGALAGAFLLPYALWNAVNGFPTLEFWTHYGGLTGGGPLGFLGNQLFIVNPVTLPIIIAGLWFYLRLPQGKPYRALGWAYVTLYILFTLLNAKAYFLAPAYPMLLAGGAVGAERFICAAASRRWLAPAYIAALLLSGVLLAPLAMPILPPATYTHSAYAALTGVGNGGAGQQTAGQFPQYLGDRFGWETMAATIERAYDGLPASQRGQACVLTENYGEASALTFFKQKYHLPPIISGHNDYYLWGPGACSGETLITVGLIRDSLLKLYGNVVQVATITCDYCMSEENNLPVYLATQPKGSPRDRWPTVKHFN